MCARINRVCCDQNALIRVLVVVFIASISTLDHFKTFHLMIGYIGWSETSCLHFIRTLCLPTISKLLLCVVHCISFILQRDRIKHHELRLSTYTNNISNRISPAPKEYSHTDKKKFQDVFCVNNSIHDFGKSGIPNACVQNH